MTKLSKLIEKLLNPATAISFMELEYLLKKLGYIPKSTGKTSGSGKAYIHITSKHILRIHKPHPDKNLKKYLKHYIVTELKKENLI